MASEILDSSGGARSVAPELVESRDEPAPLLELEELTPLTVEAPSPSPAPDGPRRRRLGPLLRRVKNDAGTRRTAVRTVLLCLLVMALTASVVEFRANRAAQAERDSRVAVDIRMADVRPVESDGPQGAVTADVQLHNLGPADVEIVALDVMNGGDASDVVLANDVQSTSERVEPGLTRETAYTIQLPCRPSFQLGFGPPQMIAKVRTVDGVLHSVPINLDAVNEQGGLLTFCVRGDDSLAPFNYGSVTDGRTVTMTIDVTNDPRQISLVAPDVGVPVRYDTLPRLPALARPGSTFVVKVTPRVTACPRTPLDLDALQGLGVSIGSQQVVDGYLPVLVAQAAGRACAERAQGLASRP